MKAKEKKDTILRLLSKRTYGLADDYSVSIQHIKFDYEDVHEDSYRLTFFPNTRNRFMDDAVLTILSTIKCFNCYCTFKSMHGAPVIYAVIEEDR